MTTLTIAHSKGGVGKSTIAWNLAIALIGMKHRVAMIDLDVQHTITHTNKARVYDTKNEPVEIFHIATVSQLSGFLSSAQYDFVLIDVGGYDFDLGRAAIALADRLIVPISDNPTELFGFITFTQFLGEIAETAPVPPLTAVINAVHPRASRFDTIFGAVALWPEASVADTVIRRRMIYASSMGNGFGVTEMADKFPSASMEIMELAREVM
jgi:chromosome partitioning protein